MMTQLTFSELTAAGRADLDRLVTERFPGYDTPQGDTRVRITDQRVELTIVRDHGNTVEGRVARFQLTDAIGEAIVDSLAKASA